MALHELRSPLGLVATAARAAAADSDDERVRRTCEVILRTAERMLRTAAEVLSIAGGLDEEPEPKEVFDAAQVTRSVVADLAELGWPIELYGGDDLTWLICGRPAHLESMLTSLISNAVDHGGPQPITVTLVAGDAALEISVTNSPSRLSSHSGLGLGMYIVGELAKLLSASVEYAEGGSCFQTIVRVPDSTGLHGPNQPPHSTSLRAQTVRARTVRRA